jgi:hypothetical protein
MASIHILIGCYLKAKQKYEGKDSGMLLKTSKNVVMTIILRDLRALADIESNHAHNQILKMVTHNIS